MGERRGRPVAAVAMGLVTAALTGAGGWQASLLFDDLFTTECFFCYGDTFAFVVGLVDSLGTIALLVVGGWAVWRLAQGRRVGAVGVVFITLVVAAVAFWGLWWVILLSNFDRCFAFLWGAGGGVVPLALAAVCLVWGLVRAWRAATGRTRGIWGHALERLPAASGPTWLVAELGADLTEVFHGKVKVLAHLAAGTTVTEVRHTVRRVLIVGPDGLSGWVDADRLAASTSELADTAPPGPSSKFHLGLRGMIALAMAGALVVGGATWGIVAAVSKGDRRFTDLQEMREVLESAGFPCDEWDDWSGQSDYVLCIHEEDFVKLIVAEHPLARVPLVLYPSSDRFLVGPNWVVSCGSAEFDWCAEFQDALGGSLMVGTGY
jgi:hypothetical protein